MPNKYDYSGFTDVWKLKQANPTSVSSTSLRMQHEITMPTSFEKRCRSAPNCGRLGDHRQDESIARLKMRPSTPSMGSARSHSSSSVVAPSPPLVSRQSPQKDPSRWAWCMPPKYRSVANLDMQRPQTAPVAQTFARISRVTSKDFDNDSLFCPARYRQ
eukprot:TRINITY_DN76788_c0_g1_i1.p1 TRINITY_DN76788_c0_g1~~TRINITY_DN76788_c0_g1_i1.p1  ORF type:complete len:159 (-),score=12.46 TRINITY_DN76788_c0_g1_i1:187-663(-)